jgi:hypothetical protein
MDNNFGSSAQNKSDNEGGFAIIPPNRSLMAGQFTAERTEAPEVVQGLQTLAQVFAHFKPEVSVDFRDAHGRLVVETLQFRQLEDFGLQGIMARSPHLSQTSAREDEYLHILNELRNNKNLQALLQSPEAKQALLETIHGMISDLNTTP